MSSVATPAAGARSPRSTRRVRRSGDIGSMLRSPLVLGVLAVLAWFSVTLLVIPNLNLLITTFFPNGQFSGSAVQRLTSSPRAMKALGNSFLLAFCLSVTTNVVGIFIVLVTQFYEVRGRRILWLGYATTLIYGGIVLASAYRLIYGDTGPVTRLLTAIVPGLEPTWFSGFGAVLFTMSLACTTNHLLFVSGALGGIDNQTVEAAKLMGASDWTILTRVVLPQLKPSLFAVTILAFLTGLGALSAPQVLGGTEFQTITPMILSFAGTEYSRDLAALLAIVLGIATIVLLAILTHVERSGSYFSVSKVSTAIVRQPIRNPLANALVHVVAWALFALYVLPVVLVIVFTFMPSDAAGTGTLVPTITLDNYARVLQQEDALRPLLVSIAYAATAAVTVGLGITVVAWMITRYKNRLSSLIEYVLHIPWILPSTMIALGLVITYDKPAPQLLGYVLTGTPWILLIAYIIIKVPFSLRVLKAAFTAMNRSWEEAAQIMGASYLTVLRRILIPAILPTLAALTALNFNSLLDDYDVAVFLSHPLFQPLGLVIVAATTGTLGTDGASNTYVYAVMLMIVTGLTMYLVYGRAQRPRRKKKRA